MLSFFRRGITAKIMLGVLAIGLFAIVITGFGTGGVGLGGIGAGGQTLAEAGDEEVTSTEMTDQINRQLARAREQQPELDIANFLRTGVYEQLLDQLIAVKAMLSFGRDIGLAASKRLIDGEIASIPAFQNVAGTFDQNAFQAALARERITEQQLRADFEQSLIQQQLLFPVGAVARIPNGLALQYASLLLERRTGSVGLVPAGAVPQGPEPTAAEINAFYAQQRSRYTVPERRVLRYAAIGPEQLGAAATPTDAEIQAFYRANQARYAARETRTLQQVVLPDEAAARQFAAKLERGSSFAQAAAEAGFSNADINVGERDRAQFASLASPEVAAAAFAAAEGMVTAPVRSELGWHVVRVEKVNRIPARPLAAVRDEIAQALGAQKREQALADLVTRIEDALADGATFEETTRQFGLSAQQTPPITATGAAETGRAAPEIAPLLEVAFEMGEDEDPVVETAGERYALLDVAQVIPAAPPPLAQVRDRVRADFIAQRAQGRARQIAAAIVAKINAGMAPAVAFAQAGVPLPPVEPVNARRIEIAQGQQGVPPPLQMMFSMKRGTAKLLEAPGGAGWFVVHLATTEVGDARSQPQLVQATRQQFSQVAGDEYAQQFAKAVERRVGVERNAEAIAALKRQLMGPGAR